jgi:cytochrome c peroxidase
VHNPGRLVVALSVLLAVLVARGGAQDSLSALPLVTPAPADNPTTPAKVELGRLLFWDPVLSGTGAVACATCHHPDFAYGDPLDLAIGVTGTGSGQHRRFAGTGVPFVRRNSPPLVNVGFAGLDEFGRVDPSTAQMFWDQRAQSLEHQALFPMRAFEEMRGDASPEDRAVEAAVARVAAIPEYRALFAAAFGGVSPVDTDNVGRALASFQRTLVAVNTPFDRFMRGDVTAMTPAQRRGLDAFTDAGCVNCHRGAMLSDYKVHALGVPDNPKLRESDSGVHGTYGFRTPSLRNLARTAPYMHNGMLPSLDAVLDFYEAIEGGRAALNPNLRPGHLAFQLGELQIGNRRADILAFLGALNDDTYDRRKPARVPSGLDVGGK